MRSGWELFNTRGRCNKCHALTEDTRDVTYFTDNDFHNIGIGILRLKVVPLGRQAERLIESGDTAAIDRAAIQTDMSALGRFLITKKEPDIASFKTPDLRNVLLTGPYFHDGSQRRSGMSATTTTKATVCRIPISTKTSSRSP